MLSQRCSVGRGCGECGCSGDPSDLRAAGFDRSPDTGLRAVLRCSDTRSGTRLSPHSLPRSGLLSLRNSVSEAGREDIDGRDSRWLVEFG